MTYNNNGKQIPYGLYYLTSDDCPECETIACVERCLYHLSADECPACESKECVERYYKDIEEISGIKLGDINYVNLSHEENPTDVNLKTFPIFVEYNENGRYIRVGNRVFCSGYPLINKDDVWEKWRFDEDTRKKMAENRRARTKELIVEDIKQRCVEVSIVDIIQGCMEFIIEDIKGCLCNIIYSRCFDKELVEECWKEVTGETISINEDAEEVTIINEQIGDVIFTQGVLFFDDV